MENQSINEKQNSRSQPAERNNSPALTAEEQLPHEAILRTCDDQVWHLHAHPSQRVGDVSWAAEANAVLDAGIDAQRIDFSRAVIQRFREFRADSAEEISDEL